MCDAVSVNKLTVNASKTKYLYFSVSSRSANFPSEPAIELNGQPLERVENVKFVGLNINQHFKLETAHAVHFLLLFLIISAYSVSPSSDALYRVCFLCVVVYVNVCQRCNDYASVYLNFYY